jgi:sugar lactone lactonase YvrE
VSRFVPRLLLCWCVAVCAGVLGYVPAGAAPGGVTPAAVLVAEPVAGTGDPGYSGDGQRGTDARIDEDGNIAVGPDGTLYLAEPESDRVRAVRGGVINTVPASLALRSPTDESRVNDSPSAVAVGRDGTLYIAGIDAIWRVARGGAITKIVDVDALGMYHTHSIAVDDGGNLYVAGSNFDTSTIVKIDRARKIKRLGGGGKLEPPSADGKPATSARLSEYGLSIAVDRQGVVYFVHAYHPGNQPRSSLHSIDRGGLMHTVAGGGRPGFGGDGGPVDKARLSGDLGGVAVAASGEVYLHDRGNGGVVRVIGTDGVITSMAPPVGEFGIRSYLTVGPDGEVYVRISAQVFLLGRKEKAPAAPAAPADYPPRFPNDEPGTVHTVAGSGHEVKPQDSGSFRYEDRMRIAVGPDGTRYYSDVRHHRVMKVAADGTGSVLAGTGEYGFGGDGGDATHAELAAPTGVDVGPDGSVYVADSGNDRVRKIDRSGVITTVAGNGQQTEDGSVRGDGGPATEAIVNPVDVAVAADGSLFVADGATSRIRRVAPDGKISTFAGGGDRYLEESDGHPAAEAHFFEPSAVAVGPGGSVYLLDRGVDVVHPAVRMIDRNGIVRTVVGDASRDSDSGFGGDGGPAKGAGLNNPQDIALGPDGTLYIADTYNARIRAVSPAGVIKTVAGTGRPADTGDGAAATDAAVNEPQTIDVDAAGALHLINLPGDRIRKIDHDTITTAGTLSASGEATSGAPSALAEAVDPTGVAVDRDGTVLMVNVIGDPTAVTRNGRLRRPFADTELLRISTVAVGPDGTRYVEDSSTVYRVPTDGPPVPVAGRRVLGQQEDRVEPGRQATLALFSSVSDLAVGPTGRLYVATDQGVYRLADDGTLTAAFTLAPNERKQYQEYGGVDEVLVDGIAVDAEDRLYVAISGGRDQVYRVDADGRRTLIAGNESAERFEEETGEATEVDLSGSSDVAVDRDGNVYIGTFDGIYRVDDDGTIMLVAANTKDRTGGSYAIGSLAVDRHGDLYYIDRNRHQVKVLVQPGQIDEPFPWGTVIWTAIGVVAVLVAGWFALLWWRRRAPRPQDADSEATTSAPAVEDEPAAENEPTEDAPTEGEPAGEEPAEEEPPAGESTEDEPPKGEHT